MSFSPAATVYVDVEGDLTKFRRDLDGAAKETSSAFNKATKVAGTAAVGAAAGIAVAAAKTFIGFEKGISEVYTLLPEASAALRTQLAEDAKAISSEFGQELGTVTTAMYDSISAGVPTDNVKTFLSDAGRLAIGGATDIGTAVDALTGVVNAYGAENITSAEAGDILFGTVKAGKTTVDELGSKIAAVTPIASELGLSFEQVGAAFAAVTAVTGNTAEASTQLRGVFAELSKDGSIAFKNFAAATGKSFREFIAGGGTVSEALIEMQGYAEENGKSLGDMFGSVEAGGAALILAADGGAKFNDSLELIEGGAGSVEAAYTEMEGTLAVQLEKVKANLSLAALNIGETIAPALGGLADGLATFAEFLAALPGPIAVFAVGLLGIGGAALLLAGPILNATRLISGMFTLLAANPYVLIIAATIALGILIYKNWDTIKTTITGAASAIGDFLTRYISEPAADIADAFERLPAIASTAWDTIKTKIGEAADWIVRKLGEMAVAADKALGPLDEILGGAAKLGGGIVGGAFGLLGFDDGGIVPGPKGAPRLVLTHGGETILPTHKDPTAGMGGGGTTNVYLSDATIRNDDDIVRLARMLAEETERSRRARGGQ